MFIGFGSSLHSILEVKSVFKKESRKLAVINFPRICHWMNVKMQSPML